MVLSGSVSKTTPHWRLVSVRANLLVCYPELRGVRYSEGQFVLVI
jgi:hypothetical protein